MVTMLVTKLVTSSVTTENAVFENNPMKGRFYCLAWFLSLNPMKDYFFYRVRIIRTRQ